MMQKEKSSARNRLKALALLPMLGAALLVAGVPAVKAAVTTISRSGISVGKNSEKSRQGQTSVQFFKVKNINNNDGVTTVVIEGEGLGNNLTVEGGTFTTMGKTYRAKSLQCNLTNGKAKITAVFPFLSEFDKCSMTLNVNGEEIPFNLENFFRNSQSLAIEGGSDVASSGKPIIIDESGTEVPSDFEVYINGEKRDVSALRNLPKGSIGSINLDMNGKAIKVTLRKN